jgi:hypothetical protein
MTSVNRMFTNTVLLCIFLTACATDVAHRYYGTVRYPSKKPAEVELLRRAPTKDYVVIADFQSRGESPEDLRKKAAEIGADAVIVSVLGGYYSVNEEWAGSEGTTYSRIIGTAIKYK